MTCIQQEEPLFPLFRERFFRGALWAKAEGNQRMHRPSNLRALDLKALPRDEGPASETQLRREKYQFFEKHCSEVAQGLFLSGDWVAKNREVLEQNHITHVVNCVGFICKEYFKDQLCYKTYYLQDTPAEDIVCVLYDAFEFIDKALSSGGRVLVHCSQGVSRSATVAIAYLMWKTGQPYDEIFARVKAIRGIANPNIGFTCQLLQWQKRRNQPPARMRMYRIVPHCQHAPLFLVPRTVTPPKKYATHTWRELDPRGAFIIQTPGRLFVWVGAACPPPFAAAAEVTARLLPKYENVGTNESVTIVEQDHEPDDFIALMDPPALDPDAEQANARRASITGDLIGSVAQSSIFGDPMDADTPAGPGPGSTTTSQAAAPIAAVAPNSPLIASPISISSAAPATSPGYGSRPGIGPPATSISFPQLSDLGAPGSGLAWDSGLLSTASGPADMAVDEQPCSSGSVALPNLQQHSSSYGSQWHPSASPMPLSTPASDGPGSLVHNNSIKAQPSPCGPPSWHVAEVEEYNADFTLYYDALKAAAITAAVGSGNSPSSSFVNSSAALLAAAGSPLGGMTGGESRLNLEASGAGASTSSPGGPPAYLQHSTSLGGSAAAAAAAAAAALAGGVSRPDSPAEGRMKKYRRGDSELAALLVDKTKRMFPSLHHSLDEDDLLPSSP